MESILERIVSVLNNYLEMHVYPFDGEYCGDATNIVSRYGLGYSERGNHVQHLVYNTKWRIERWRGAVRSMYET